ncbi:hypothetical protein B9Z55_016677 [Caenorhabditis nigoni]|uniref:Uncharacterized protein n=1 Tax=Caenorhabditis nigoni TaxID=1611254 RepID=A0A2G5T6B7_9PELO|nr:hypothetical protein B9Z55_016677 [Caenorhabditis nigoni]
MDELKEKISDILTTIKVTVEECMEMIKGLDICQTVTRPSLQMKNHVRVFSYGYHQFVFKYEVNRFLRRNTSLAKCMDDIRKTGIYETVGYLDLITEFGTDPSGIEYVFIELPRTSRRPVPVPTFEGRYAEFGPDFLLFQLADIISARLLFHGFETEKWDTFKGLINELLINIDPKKEMPCFVDTSKIEAVQDWMALSLDGNFKKKPLKILKSQYRPVMITQAIDAWKLATVFPDIIAYVNERQYHHGYYSLCQMFEDLEKSQLSLLMNKHIPELAKYFHSQKSCRVTNEDCEICEEQLIVHIEKTMATYDEKKKMPKCDDSESEGSRTVRFAPEHVIFGVKEEEPEEEPEIIVIDDDDQQQETSTPQAVTNKLKSILKGAGENSNGAGRSARAEDEDVPQNTNPSGPTAPVTGSTSASSTTSAPTTTTAGTLSSSGPSTQNASGTIPRMIPPARGATAQDFRRLFARNGTRTGTTAGATSTASSSGPNSDSNHTQRLPNLNNQTNRRNVGRTANEAVPSHATSSSEATSTVTAQAAPNGTSGSRVGTPQASSVNSAATQNPVTSQRTEPTSEDVWCCTACKLVLGSFREWGLPKRKQHMREHGYNNFSSCKCHQWQFETVAVKDKHCLFFTEEVENTDFAPTIYKKCSATATTSGGNQAKRHNEQRPESTRPPKRQRLQPAHN